MRAIEVDGRAFLQPLEAPRPAHLGESARDGGVVDGEAALGEQARRGDGGERVAHLKASGERQANFDFRRLASACRVYRLRCGHESVAAVFGARVGDGDTRCPLRPGAHFVPRRDAESLPAPPGARLR